MNKHRILVSAFWILAALLLVTCEDSDNGQSSDNTAPALTFQTIEKGNFSGISLSSPQVFKIDNTAEWAEFWARHKSNMLPIPAAPAIDFSQYSVIAVIDEEHGTGGFGLEVEAVLDQGDRLDVLASGTEPGRTCFVAQVVTHPFHIILIDKTPIPPQIVQSTTVRDC